MTYANAIKINELIALLTAFRDGKTLEIRPRQPGAEWSSLTNPEYCRWDLQNFGCWVKAEPPKPREWWIYPTKEKPSYSWIFKDKPLNPDWILVREVLPETGQ